jgi:hypothetical protein
VLSVALWSIPVIFAAGGAWKTLKDLKGVSGKVNREADKRDKQFTALMITVLQALPEEKRSEFAALLMAQK